MTLNELRSLSVQQLRDRAAEEREALARLSMKRHARRLDKSSDLGLAKKNLARVLTVLREKARTEEEGARS
jgi:large subunit ribosomal protein L29